MSRKEEGREQKMTGLYTNNYGNREILRPFSMSQIYETGSRGERLLTNHLRTRGRKVEPSDKKTFDLIVDGKYAEVKTSDGPYAKLGFIGLTDGQYQALKSGVAFSVFLVCNAQDPDALEVIEFDGAALLAEEPKVECTYYYYRSQLERCRSSTSTDAVPPESRDGAVIVAAHPPPGGNPPVTPQSRSGRITAHIRRLAANPDAELYIRFSKEELASANLQHGQRIELDLNGKVKVVGTVKTTGSTPWLSPGSDTTNAKIDAALRQAGFSYGDDVPGTFRTP